MVDFKKLSLRHKVFKALNNALENGYNFIKGEPIRIAYDIINHNSELENKEPKDLVEFIIKWQKEKQNAK
jgi:hypothetical protein